MSISKSHLFSHPISKETVKNIYEVCSTLCHAASDLCSWLCRKCVAHLVCRKSQKENITTYYNRFAWFTFHIFSSEEEGEEILRQRGQFPALPFTASDSGSPSPRSPRSPGSVSSYSNGGSPLGVPWGDFSATADFKYPTMPASHKYSSNGRLKRKANVPDGFVKSPASGKGIHTFFVENLSRYWCTISRD